MGTVPLIGVGFVSEFSGGSTSLNSPPVALFLMNQQQDKETLRANIVHYFPRQCCKFIIHVFNENNRHNYNKTKHLRNSWSGSWGVDLGNKSNYFPENLFRYYIY